MNLVRAVGQAQRALVGIHAGQLEDLADAAGAMQLKFNPDFFTSGASSRPEAAGLGVAKSMNAQVRSSTAMFCMLNAIIPTWATLIDAAATSSSPLR